MLLRRMSHAVLRTRPWKLMHIKGVFQVKKTDSCIRAVLSARPFLFHFAVTANIKQEKVSICDHFECYSGYITKHHTFTSVNKLVYLF